MTRTTMPRILLLATTTGYQTRAFGEAAERIGADLVFATDRCAVIEDPWRDEALPIRFHEEDAAVRTIVEADGRKPIDGIVAVGDRPTTIAALAAEALRLPAHPPEATRVARHKLLLRERLREAGLPSPWFVSADVDDDPRRLAASIGFPCVVKPVALSGSRGVMRVDDEPQLVAAFYRLRSLLQSADIRGERFDAHRTVVVEQFIEGPEFAVEGLVQEGVFRTLAIFDKPDPLDGPFFEESIYVTPSSAPQAVQAAIERTVSRAAAAVGLWHGPVHAECRVNANGVFVLETAARPIGGLCARALRFAQGGTTIAFEELLLRQAVGEPVEGWAREPDASAVMMIPIPKRGILRGVSGTDAARRVPGVWDVRITAKPDQLLVPLPEGASYLGFVFARAAHAADAEAAVRAAHAQLDFTIAPEVRMLQSVHG
jgi:biotin carboxylase